MRKQKLRIFFCDFWPTFNPQDNYFLSILSRRYDVNITDQDPDLILYSVFGVDFLRYKCKRIFYTGENIKPNFNVCDYSFSFEYDDYSGRNFRLPVYIIDTDFRRLINRGDIDQIVGSKKLFCNFLYSNNRSKDRITFFRKLSKYKKVDSGGKVLNNIGHIVIDKLSFLCQYKFTISFENECSAGYTTEKIVDPLIVGSIPIYKGNNRIGEEFNDKSFVNWHNYRNDDDVIERIIEIDTNNDLYMRYLSQPPLHNNELNRFMDEDAIIKTFERIIEDTATPRAASKNLLTILAEKKINQKHIIKAMYRQFKALLKK